MPRPAQSEEQRDQIRQRIIAAGRDLFDAKGIDGVSMRAVGARVGLTASALYAYFPGKDELLQALWSDAREELDRQARALSRQKTDPIEAIKALGMAYARFALENPVRFRVLYLFDNSRLAAELNNDLSRETAYVLLLNKVAEAVDRGQLRLRDPELVAQTLWAGIHGVLCLVNSWADFPFKPAPLMVSTMMDTLLAGMLNE